MAEKKITTTVGLSPTLIAEIKAQADRSELPWTVMIGLLVREALDARKGRKP